MNNYCKLYKEFYTKFAADFDIDAIKKRIAETKARTPLPFDPPQPVQKKDYSGLSGQPIPRHAVPSPSDDTVVPATPVRPQNPTTRPVNTLVRNTKTQAPSSAVTRAKQPVNTGRNQLTVPATRSVPAANTSQATPNSKVVPTANAAQPTSMVQGQQNIQTIPNTNIQYIQYAENDPRLKRYKRRLKRMGFARFDENGPWIATPHGTSIMRELPQGLDRGAIQEMLEEGKVPVGVFDASTLLAQRAKAAQQKASAAQVAQQTTPVVNTPYQVPQRVNVSQQTVPQTKTYSQPTNKGTRRRPPTTEEALRMRQERINRDIYKKHPVLAQIDEYNRKRKAIEADRRREEQDYRQWKSNKMALGMDIMNNHVPYNTAYKMTPEQQARWDFYKKNPEFFPFGDVNNYYNKPSTLSAEGLPPKTVSEKLNDFYHYDILPAYFKLRENTRNFLYDLNTPFRQMSYLINN